MTKCRRQEIALTQRKQNYYRSLPGSGRFGAKFAGLREGKGRIKGEDGVKPRGRAEGCSKYSGLPQEQTGFAVTLGRMQRYDAVGELRAPEGMGKKER